MRKRLLLSVGFLACLLAGLVAFLWLTGPKHRITRENFARIQEGMTQEDVEEILACPSGDYGPGMDLHALRFARAIKELQVWSKGEIAIYVVFDQDKVKYISIRPTVRYPGPESFPDKLRHWLGLPWW